MTRYHGLAIVVVNYGTHRLLTRNLQQVARRLPGTDVVVVDNFCSQSERESVQLLARSNGWEFVPLPENRGFGAGVNAGVSHALNRGAATVLLLNPDLVVEADAVDIMMLRLRDEPLTMVAPLILRPDGTVWSDGNELLLSDGSMRSRRSVRRGDETHGVVPWLSGACLMVSAELWCRVAGMADEYFMYWEDVEFSYRVTTAGGTLDVERAAVAVHDEGGSQRTPSRSGFSHLYYYFNVRNRLLFASRNLEPDGVARWRRTAFRESARILRRGGRRQFMRLSTPIGTGWRGLRDGLRLSRTTERPNMPLRVMVSYPPPGRVRNPYNSMLVDSLRKLPSVDVDYFSWRGALLERHDVFHAHWPEATMTSPSRFKGMGKQIAFALLLAKSKVTRTAWVRTVHNLGLPKDLGLLQIAILKAEGLATTLRIVLTPVTRLSPQAPQAVIPHGHYIDWFDGMPRGQQVSGRLAFVGGIRRYKGVPTLIQAFRKLEDPSLSLSVSGRLSHPEYEAELRGLAHADPRVSLELDFVPDEELVRLVTQAELVVLPYPEMHNSGMVLCCLSLDRPVLVPDNEVNRMLADEVGQGWLYFFSGELTDADLRSALAWVRTTSRVKPDLSRRDWAASAQGHAEAYQRAVSLVRGSVSRGAVVDRLRREPVVLS